MSKLIVGPNDVFVVETAEIREMAEKNGVIRAVEMLDETGSTFVKLIFEETEIGFIEPRHEFLDQNKNKIENAKMPLSLKDMLSFIGKFNNVERIEGSPNNGEKIRTRNSAVKTDYEVFRDGDVFHVPYNDFISAMRNVAHEDYLKQYERMKEYGIEHILFSFHYRDGRKDAGNKLYSLFEDDKSAKIQPYYRMGFDIWATDSQGKYFYEGSDETKDESKKEFDLINSLKTMKRDYIHAMENKEVSFDYCRLGSFNINLFFNDYDLVRNLNRVGNVSNDERAYVSVSEMIPLVNKVVGRKYTVQDGDSYHIPTSNLSHEIKKKYGIDDTVNTLLVDVSANSVESKYLNIEASFVSGVKSEKGPSLLVREFDEILSDSDQNRGQVFINRRNPEMLISRRENGDKKLSSQIPGVSLDKPYLINVEDLEALNNTGLNKQLAKVKTLGNTEVLIALKKEVPYKLNGRTDILTHRYNKEVDFNLEQFPELDIYVFNNQTGKGYDPAVLKSMTVESILKDQDAANQALTDKSDDSVFPSNDRSLKSASIYALGAAEIFTLLKDATPLIESSFKTGFFSEKTEFNLYMVSKIGKERVKELSQDLVENQEISPRPRMR
ncbi:hypothetical protein [Serratia sp. Se-RSBMAAmG]|uniref:hypothetical protein n=1 Tax=Serratia sp. Se-RSBMAAmG TaxID=3043305 RepID=UPI0024AF44C4|nr:hypothetical protein [Serratia sp. Se-RSBMAAmG]MDI6977197.1 hypothetical protein [Serratia sp. Se-RSBMAAmG]